MTGFTGWNCGVYRGESGALDGQALFYTGGQTAGSEIILLKQGLGCPKSNLYGQNCRKAERSDLMAVRFGTRKNLKIAEENAERCLIFRILSMLSGGPSHDGKSVLLDEFTLGETAASKLKSKV